MIKRALYLIAGLSVVFLVIFSVFSMAMGTVEEHQYDPFYTNPLTGGQDPTTNKLEDGYYYTCFSNGSNTVYLKRAQSLIELSKAESKAIWVAPPKEEYGYLWGPYIYRINGKWYVYFTSGKPNDYGNPYSYCIENSSPDPFEGTWVEKGLINTESNGIVCGIETINGEMYLSYTKYYWNKEHTRFIESPNIVKMLNPWTVTGKEIQLAIPEYNWEKYGDPINEGSAMLEKDGKYYFSYSTSGYWTDQYGVGLSVADKSADLFNPLSWKKHPLPLISKSAENSVFGPGSPRYTKSEDGLEDWLIFHVGPVQGKTGDIRTIFQQKVNWTNDGFISVGPASNTKDRLLKPSGSQKTIIVEAEKGELSDASKARLIPEGPSSGGVACLEFSNGNAVTAKYIVNVRKSGDYSIEFRYHNKSTYDVPLILSVNGNKSYVHFPAGTGDDDNYRILSLNNIQLNKGKNTIELSTISNVFLNEGISVDVQDMWSGLWLDCMMIKKATVYEAEDAVLTGGTVVSNQNFGYTGIGFVKGYENQGASVKFNVDVPLNGNYAVKLRYANDSNNGSGIKTLSLYVNSEKVKQINLYSTGSWDRWLDRIDTLYLKEGSNIIEYRMDEGDTGFVHLDYIIVIDALTLRYEAEDAVYSQGNETVLQSDVDAQSKLEYVSGFDKPQSKISFKVDIDRSALYGIAIRYQTDSNEKPLNLYVNGQLVKQVVLERTSHWIEKIENVTLDEGINYIEFRNDYENNDILKLDYIHLSSPIYDPNGFMSGNVYAIINKQSSKALSLANESLADGVSVVQQTWANQDTQKWRIEPYGGGYYKIVNYYSHRLLDVAGMQYRNGNHLYQWIFNFQPSQEWIIKDNGDGYYKILTKINSKAIEVPYLNNSDNANVIINNLNSEDNQLWQIKQINP